MKGWKLEFVWGENVGFPGTAEAKEKSQISKHQKVYYI